MFTRASGQRTAGFSGWPEAHMSIFDAEKPPLRERSHDVSSRGGFKILTVADKGGEGV